MDFNKIINFIKESKLTETDKQSLLVKLQDTSLSDDDKKNLLRDFVNNKDKELSIQLEAIMAPVLSKAKESLDKAESEFNATLEDINKKIDVESVDLDKKLDGLQ